MSEEKRDKTLSVKVSETAQKVFKELSDEAGVNQGDFLEELINEWRMRKLEEGAVDKIPADLQSIFQSDVAKLKIATNAINTLFISQMENLSNEKIVWQSKLEELQEKIKHEKEQVKLAQDEVKAIQKEKADAEKELDMQRKENEAFNSRIQDLIESIEDKKGIITSKEQDIAELNALIVKKENEIEKLQSFKVRNEELEQENKAFSEQIADLTRVIEQEKATSKEQLKKKQEEFELECKKSLIEREFSLQDGFRKQEDAIRKEVRQSVTDEVKAFYVTEIKEIKKQHQNEINQLKKQYEALQQAFDEKNKEG